MEPFFNPDRIWPAGHTRLHVYIHPHLPDHPRLANLIGQARAVCRQFPDANPQVPDAWLHLTVASIPHADSDADSDVHALAEALRHATQDIPPFTLRMGSVVANASSVLLDGDDPDNGFSELRQAVTCAVTNVTGRPPLETREPHLAIAYAPSAAATDSGPIGSALRRACRPPHAPLYVPEALLVNVTQDPTRGVYTWDTVARLPLAARPGSS